MSALNPCVSSYLPVLWPFGSKHAHNWVDHATIPSPQRPVIEGVHPILWIKNTLAKCEVEGWEDHDKSHPEEKIRAVASYSAVLEISIFLVDFEWLSQSEEKAVERIPKV